MLPWVANDYEGGPACNTDGSISASETPPTPALDINAQAQNCKAGKIIAVSRSGATSQLFRK
jgi:hypothetical protein